MTKGIYGKAALYAIPLFLAPCIEKLADVMQDGIWPSPQRLVFCTMLGLSGMCIGLRAYFDGSAEREKQRNEITSSETLTQTTTETKTPEPKP